MMTSAADLPSSGWISAGIPRPLSATVTDSSAWIVTTIRSQKPARCLVDRVVDNLENHVVQTGAIVGISDVHARTFPHCIKTL